jgi:hypothetical protein
VGYSLALIVPAFFAFNFSGLGTIVPTVIAPVLLMMGVPRTVSRTLTGAFAATRRP